MKEKFIAAIMGKRHAHYYRTIQVRNFSYQMATGEGHKMWVTRYKPSEKTKLKEQRYNLYNPLTKYVLNRPRKYFKKFAQVQGVNITLETTSTRKKEIETCIESFVDGKTLMEYLVETLEYYGVTDPNAWIFYDRFDYRNSEGAILDTGILPVVIKSVDVLDYGQNYFCFRETRIEQVSNTEKVFENFFCLVVGGFFKAVEESPSQGATENPESMKVTLRVSGQDRVFYVTHSENGSLELPVKSVGAYLDEKTDQRTYVSWFDPADNVLQDLIRDKSLFDVNVVSTSFPRRYEYTKACDHEHPQKGRCVGGWYNNKRDKENICISCNGTGKIANHTTEQEVLQLAMPKEQNGFLELSRLSHTEPIDTNWPTFLKEQIQIDVNRVIEAVVNSGIVERATGAATATETNYAMEDVYDMLRPFERTVCGHWELVVRLIGQYKEIELDMVDFRFPKDKKMKTMAHLLEDLKKAKESGAGYDVVRQIQINIMEKQGEDNPKEIARAIARLDWMPFADKTPEQVVMILAVRSATDFDRVLYENFLKIFSEIEAENNKPYFHDMTYVMQKKVVASKVAEIQKTITLAGNEQKEESPEG